VPFFLPEPPDGCFLHLAWASSAPEDDNDEQIRTLSVLRSGSACPFTDLLRAVPVIVGVDHPELPARRWPPSTSSSSGQVPCAPTWPDYLAPAFAVLYGLAFLDERLHPAAFAGLALILAGSCLAAA